jgi:hypothetical protein
MGLKVTNQEAGFLLMISLLHAGTFFAPFP